MNKPHEIRTNAIKGRNGELLCHNCGRIGWQHVPFAPFHCKNYEGEKILDTTFEAHIYFKNWPTLPSKQEESAI